MNNPIIKARFMHQHKDRVVYEREIVLDTPSLNQYDGKTTTYLEFDMPLLLGIEPKFIKRWVMIGQNCRVTRRVLRFVDADGTMLYELSKRPLKATMYISSDFMTIRICCAVDYGEAKELAKIFFKYNLED